MLFSGTVFLLLFLPLLLLVYFIIPNRYLSVRNVVLIVFSLIFYSFGGIKYTAFLLLSALLNYLGALTVSVLSKPHYRRTVMILTVLVNLTLPLIPWLKERFSERTWAYTAGKACTWLIFLYSYIKLVTGSFNPFIYFHF